MKKLFVLTGLAVLAVALVPAEVLAALPNYAQGGNLESDLQSKGQAITKILSLIVGIVSIMGILVGAVKIGGGNQKAARPSSSVASSPWLLPVVSTASLQWWDDKTCALSTAACRVRKSSGCRWWARSVFSHC